MSLGDKHVCFSAKAMRLSVKPRESPIVIPRFLPSFSVLSCLVGIIRFQYRYKLKSEP
jgi:hypothetical protein